jgi:hypothetical protein
VSAPSTAVWQTGTESQKSLRMETRGILAGPVALFAGGISPTTGGGSHGVVASADTTAGTNGDFAATVSGLVVTLGAGQCFINGTSSIDQGAYYWYQNASSTVTLATYNTQARTDLIGVWVKDNAEDSSGATTTALDKVTGTPGAGVPTVPVGFEVMWQAAVPANSGTVVLTDKRTYASAVGGVIRCKSTQRPSGAARWQGQVIYELDTNRMWAYSGTAWQPVKGRFGCSMGVTSAVIGTGSQTVIWTNEFEDTDGYSVADGSNQAITIPAGLGGKYNVTVWVASTAATAVGKVEIIRAGVSTLGAQSICVGGTDTTVARQVTLGAGDVITLKVTNGSASTTFNVTVELWRESE